MTISPPLLPLARELDLEARNTAVLAAIHHDVVTRGANGKRRQSTDSSNGWNRDYFRDQKPWLVRRRSNALGDLKKLTAMASLVPELPIAERWKSLDSILKQANGCIAEIEHADAALGSIAVPAVKVQGRGVR